MFKKLASPRAIFVSVYAVFLAVYIIVGLQPVSATSTTQIINTLSIPSIDLETNVAKLTLKDKELQIPDDIVGEFHTSKKNHLLLGHSTTIFRNLENLNIGDTIYYGNNQYIVSTEEIKDKDQVNMKDLLRNTGAEKITLMTCAGELLENQDATRRLIITAEKVNQSIGVNK